MAARKRKQGRPSKFTDEIADAICERLADGESLRTICRDEGMPDKSTVFRWLEVNETFRDRYARARQAQADALFEEILEIADDGRNDKFVKDGAEVVDHENIQRSRLRVDARKWMAGKLRPEKYGDKLELSGNPAAPLTVNIVRFTDSTPNPKGS